MDFLCQKATKYGIIGKTPVHSGALQKGDDGNEYA
jgi:hypothetical protein